MVNNHRVLTSGGLTLVITLCVIVSLAAMPLAQPASDIDFGLYIPSPNLWPLLPAWGKLINLIIIFGSALLIYFFNKYFSIIKTGQPIWASIFLPLCCGNIILSGNFSQAGPCFLMILGALFFILKSYKNSNATRKIFSATLFLSAGSLFEHSFILFIPALIFAMLEMKVLRIREFMAMILGLITPYWIAAGFGLIDLSNINIFIPEPIFISAVPKNMFVIIVALAIITFASLLLTLNNGIKLYAGNAQLRNYVNVINIFGIFSMAGVIFDFSNIMAYLMIINLWSALQLGIIYTIWNIRKGRIVYWLIQSLIFLFSLTLAFTLIPG